MLALNARPLARALAAAPATPALLVRAASSAAANGNTPAAASTEHLNWDSFLRLRRLRRRYNFASSVVTSFLGTSAGMGYLANKEIDVTTTVLGMDPLMMFGLATISCGAVGWLAGPTVGGSMFNIVERKWVKQIAEVRPGAVVAVSCAATAITSSLS